MRYVLFRIYENTYGDNFVIYGLHRSFIVNLKNVNKNLDLMYSSKEDAENSLSSWIFPNNTNKEFQITTYDEFVNILNLNEIIQ